MADLFRKLARASCPYWSCFENASRHDYTHTVARRLGRRRLKELDRRDRAAEDDVRGR